MKQTIKFKLNDKSIKLAIDGERMLLWVLRTNLGLTGTKNGCGEGFCGACTVLVNNKAQRSCQIPVKDVAEKEVLTIEGLGKNGNLHPIQEAFIKHDALQCGFCTPGMILNGYSLLQEIPQPTIEDIHISMDENLCRCGAYNRIVLAIQTAAQVMKGGGNR